MRVLALDTTERAGSLALVVDDDVIEVRAGDASRPHAERLPGEILAILSAHGMTPADVDVFAVASGPGSFTGLRIGIATIQGLAFVRQRPVAAVSALDALAHIAGASVTSGLLVGAWMDAHRHDVFSALYRIGTGPAFSDARLETMAEPAVAPPSETIARWRALAGGEPIAVIGGGAELYATTLNEAGVRPLGPTPPLAGAIGRVATSRARAGGLVTAAGVQPLYVRRPDAEVAREAARAVDVGARRE